MSTEISLKQEIRERILTNIGVVGLLMGVLQVDQQTVKSYLKKNNPILARMDAAVVIFEHFNHKYNQVYDMYDNVSDLVKKYFSINN